jgi:hypothetical protein
MFEICLEDVNSFKIQSIKLYEDEKTRYMALMADFVLAHKDIPTVQITAHGGLVMSGCFQFDIRVKDEQDIISRPAILKIEDELVELMDTLLDFAFRAKIGHMY